MSPEAWAFCGVLVTQVVAVIVGISQSRRADNSDEIAALAKDLNTVKVDVVETKTEVKNLKGWVGSIDRRLST